MIEHRRIPHRMSPSGATTPTATQSAAAPAMFLPARDGASLAPHQSHRERNDA